MTPYPKKNFSLTAKLVATAAAGLMVTASSALAVNDNRNADLPIVKVQLVEDIGASERVNFSGKLRMLSQRIPAAACNYNAGVAPDVARDVLSGAADEFDKIVNALTYGDPSMNVIGEETRRKTLHRIGKLNELWAPFRQSVDVMLEKPNDAAAYSGLAENNMRLLDAAKRLVSEISGQYSNPAELLQSDALVIDIAGRQRMLTQKISKEACMIWSGMGDADTAKALADTMNLFEVSLSALINGLPEAGIIPAPNEEIKTGLDEIWADWTAMKVTLAELTEGEGIPADTQVATFKKLNTTLANMNAVVGMYTERAKYEY